jgi:hypothetical protein
MLRPYNWAMTIICERLLSLGDRPSVQKSRDRPCYNSETRPNRDRLIVILGMRSPTLRVSGLKAIALCPDTIR